MKNLGNNRKGTLTDFIRYIRGEMTKREENNFQRYLQKDPFAEEASEGFSQLSPEELEHDLDILGKKIKNRTARKQKYIYYRIAASIAVLMIISSVYIISTRDRTERELSKSAVSETPVEIPVTGIEEKSEDNEPKAVIQERDIEESPPESIAEESAEEFAEEVIPDRKEEAVTGDIADLAGYEAGYETDERAMDMAEIQAKAPVTQKKAAITQVGGTIPPEEVQIQAAPENIPAKGISSRVAMDTEHILEMMSADSTEQTSHFPPVPLYGKESYDKYIEENIRIPDILPEDQSVIVELEIRVKSTGAIDTILVTNSPGNEFSEEAIRLIKEGPPWKPAEENGNPVDKEVKINIPFN